MSGTTAVMTGLSPGGSNNVSRVIMRQAANTAEPDATAFTAMYRQQYPRVLNYLLRRCADLTLAEDCAAETFTIAWQAAADSVPHPGWIFVTARNVLANHQRAEVRLTELRNRLGVEASRSSWPGLAPPVDYDDPTAQRLLEAMELLSSEQRDLLMAHYWDGLSGAECAELFDCSPAAVWVRLHRARRTLADLYLTHRSTTERAGPPSAAKERPNDQTRLTKPNRSSRTDQTRRPDLADQAQPIRPN